MCIIQRNGKLDEKSDSILQLENCFRSIGIGESAIIYMNLYLNKCVLVNKLGIQITGDIIEKSQISPKCGYVNEIPSQIKLQISSKPIIKSSKS